MDSKDVGKQLAEKTFRELFKTDNTAKSRTSQQCPTDRRIERYKRQWTSDQGYKASATWQTLSLLRDLILLWTTTSLHVISLKPPVNFRTISRLRAQVEDAARSMVSTFEEGWGRPSTKEFLDFIGFSQGSLNEIRGDVERLLTDGLIKSAVGSTLSLVGIPTPSRNFPYPPATSRKSPGIYGNLQGKLREYTGKEIQAENLTYEMFIELVNKSSFLLRKTAEGLLNRLSERERRDFENQLDSLWRKYW